jgi:DNA-directed RNA polymerase specialized sigma24 family protein
MTQTIHVTEHLDPNTLCAFIDGELATTNQQEIQEHLTHCHPCTLRALSLSQLKAAIAQVGLRFIPYAFDSIDWDQVRENDPIRSEHQATLYAGLLQIQPPFREPLLLCDVEVVKYHDIGTILDTPVETVMSRISIARDTIRQTLQQQFGEPQ